MVADPTTWRAGCLRELGLQTYLQQLCLASQAGQLHRSSMRYQHGSSGDESDGCNCNALQLAKATGTAEEESELQVAGELGSSRTMMSTRSSCCRYFVSVQPQRETLPWLRSSLAFDHKG